jgi:predicted phage baseplate assembly protein
MPLPSPNLDDLRFQNDLVDEARKRIIHYCPEWTEYNLSDPGITMIELFAWMIETLTYRLNRVPEKNYVKFLELLGLQYQPASSARTELTFWLSTSLPISDENETVTIPESLQVRTVSGSAEEITFSVDQKKEIFPAILVQLRRDSELHKNYRPRLGIEIFRPFQEKPVQGDTFYIGFSPDKDISAHIFQLAFTCEPTEAVGIRRQDPPLVWECSMGNGVWQEVTPSTFPDENDTTGGLNNPEGHITFYLPLTASTDVVHGQTAYWLRCRFQQRNESQGLFTESPRIATLQVATLGATVPATHAEVVENEALGQSNGDPGQMFHLSHAPVLALHEGECLEIEEMRNGEIVYVPWSNVPGFAHAEMYDRCFTLEPATGTVELGPSVRQPDGTVHQYGRIPENGRAIRFSRYRYGGGAKGNVPANTLQTMASSFAYLARVTNLQRASGGRDQESLEEVKLRAQRELQSQKRAVTAQDYELLLKNFSRTIARVKCLTPQEHDAGVKPGSVELVVVPSVREALLESDLSRLHLTFNFIQDAKEYLNHYRLLTTSVQIREPQYTGVKVHADIVVDDFNTPEVVQSRLMRCLQDFLSPIPLLEEGSELRNLFIENKEGWEFGRGLFLAEISSLIQRVPGVKYVMGVKVFTRSIDPEHEGLRIADIDAEEPLTPLTEPVLWLSENGLICSLAHEINIVDMSVYQKGKGK